MQTCDPVIERANISNSFQKNMLLKKNLHFCIQRQKQGFQLLNGIA